MLALSISGKITRYELWITNMIELPVMNSATSQKRETAERKDNQFLFKQLTIQPPPSGKENVFLVGRI
jgi:hypothetical protein